MSLAGDAIVAIWNGITPAGRDGFYDWHVHEHMPERVGIPGFLRGRRYIAEWGAPEFFTLYEATSIETLDGQDSQSRLNNPTPWTLATVAHFRDVARAIVESATVRLRPILMTSIATVAGALPLVLAGGPGSASRATIGVVLIAGVAFSTLLSLFVVPAFYTLLAPFTRSPEAVAQELAKQQREVPSVGGHA